MKTYMIIGSSRGIGRALALKLLETDAVIGISRTPSEIEHGNFMENLLDITSDSLPEMDRLDGLVYCPGTINLKPFSRFSDEDFVDDFKINVLGAIRVLQGYERALKKAEQPSVVLFSTVASSVGMPYHSSVAVSKSGIEGLVRSLAAEWAPKIRINAIAPTLTDTPLASGILRNEDVRTKMEERHPLKRILAAEEVAQLAGFLLSESSASQSGQIFPMDCGMIGLRS